MSRILGSSPSGLFCLKEEMAREEYMIWWAHEQSDIVAEVIVMHGFGNTDFYSPRPV